MADNTTLNPGTGGDTYGADDIGGVKFQRVKLIHGADGVNAGDVAVANGLPVAGDVAHDAVDSGAPVKIGLKANSSAPTQVAAGDRVDAWADLFGRQVVSDLDPEVGLAGGMTVLRDRLVVQRYTVLADSIADGLASFWTITTVGGGSVSVTVGEGSVQTGAANGGSAQMVSTAPAYHPGQVAWLNSAIHFGDTGVAGSTLRVGACTVSGLTPQDGFYYELDGTTLNAVTVKAGVATAVASTSWTRVAAAPFTLDTNFHQFELRWTANRADFLIDNVLRHTATGGGVALTATLNFPIFLQSINTSAGVNRMLAVRNIGLGRFGTPPASTQADRVFSSSLITGGGNTLAVDKRGQAQVDGVALQQLVEISREQSRLLGKLVAIMAGVTGIYTSDVLDSSTYY